MHGNKGNYLYSTNEENAIYAELSITVIYF